LLITVDEVVPTVLESEDAPNCVGSVDWHVTLPLWAMPLIAELLVQLRLTRTCTFVESIR
jgi:hypothetical protein